MGIKTFFTVLAALVFLSQCNRTDEYEKAKQIFCSESSLKKYAIKTGKNIPETKEEKERTCEDLVLEKVFFSFYASQFEKQYGSFSKKPKLRTVDCFEACGMAEPLTYEIFLNVEKSCLYYKKEIIQHELSHLVFFDIVKNFKLESKLDSLPGLFVSKIIREGSAEYITKNYNPDYKPRLPKYIMYYKIMEPILDEFGIEKGIKKVLLNPPKTLEEFIDQRYSYYERLGLKFSLKGRTIHFLKNELEKSTY